MWPIRPRRLLPEGKGGEVEYTLPFRVLEMLASCGTIKVEWLDRPWRFCGFAEPGTPMIRCFCACQQRITSLRECAQPSERDAMHTVDARRVRVAPGIIVAGVAVRELWAGVCDDCRSVLWLLPEEPTLCAYQLGAW